MVFKHSHLFYWMHCNLLNLRDFLLIYHCLVYFRNDTQVDDEVTVESDNEVDEVQLTMC